VSQRCDFYTSNNHFCCCDNSVYYVHQPVTGGQPVNVALCTECDIVIDQNYFQN